MQISSFACIWTSPIWQSSYIQIVKGNIYPHINGLISQRLGYIISLGTLQVGIPSLDTFSGNLNMFEVVFFVKDRSDKVGNA